jgi:hypothetical protein
MSVLPVLASISSLTTDKQDLLQTIQAFASRFYTANGLILPSQDAGHTANGDRSRTSSPIRMAIPTGVISRDSPRSLSESNLTRQGSLRRAATQEQTNSEIVSVSSLSGESKRGGGQYGKRKKRDMHLALDGSALIALGKSPDPYETGRNSTSCVGPEQDSRLALCRPLIAACEETR